MNSLNTTEKEGEQGCSHVDHNQSNDPLPYTNIILLNQYTGLGAELSNLSTYYAHTFDEIVAVSVKLSRLILPHPLMLCVSSLK